MSSPRHSQFSSVRPAAVAGAFYPGDAGELSDVIGRYLANDRGETAVPKAIIVPHAGYVYSGGVAARAYAPLAAARDTIRRIILLGPCHRVALRGLGLSSTEAFATPLGMVPIDKDAANRALALPQVSVNDAAHAQEHSLEVQLPFLQTVLGDFSIVPLVVGEATDDDIAQVIDALWGGPETLIVISSDLSHFLDYQTAQRLDNQTRSAIEALDPGAINTEQACGRAPVRGLLKIAQQKAMKVTTLEMKNSGDTAGPRDRVVGYGSWAFYLPDTGSGDDAFAADTHDLLARFGGTLVRLAGASIRHGLDHGCALPVDITAFDEPLRANGASFITLTRHGKLRGCVGSPTAHCPLAIDIAENGFAAAFRDSRFAALTNDELSDLAASVSILSPPAPMDLAGRDDLLSQLRPGIDGLILKHNDLHALFLPSVWETLPEVNDFVSHLMAKAGLPSDFWSQDMTARRFITAAISSDDLDLKDDLWNTAFTKMI